MQGNEDRQAWIGLLARAPAEELARLWAAAGPEPAFGWLRPPETGGVMVRVRGALQPR